LLFSNGESLPKLTRGVDEWMRYRYTEWPHFALGCLSLAYNQRVHSELAKEIHGRSAKTWLKDRF